MHRFRNLLKTELKKSFKNKFFLISLIMGLLFAFMSGLYNVEAYQEYSTVQIEGNPMVQGNSLYNTWIGGECGSLGFTLFYTFLPLLAVIPYGWSYAMERKTGYAKMVQIRAGRISYFGAKYIATFLTGGVVIVVPLIFNLLFVACFVPAIQPTWIYSVYYPYHYGAIWSYLFFTQPIIFEILYLILVFIFAGLFSVMGFAVSFYTNKRVMAVLVPYFLILALHYSRRLLYGRVYKELSPLNFLHAMSIENSADAGIIFAEAIIFLGITIGIVIGKGRKDEDL